MNQIINVPPQVVRIKANSYSDVKLGTLGVYQQDENFNFDVKRIYYIANVPQGASRGFHAHYNLSQVILCVKGKVQFVVEYADTKEIIDLHEHEGLLIKGLVWREMHHFSEDCVLCVLASDWYDEKDYIRDYGNFKAANLVYKESQHA